MELYKKHSNFLGGEERGGEGKLLEKWTKIGRGKRNRFHLNPNENEYIQLSDFQNSVSDLNLP